MANEEQLSILRQGVEVWNKWRYEVDEFLDLSDVDLRSFSISGVDFTDVFLWKTNLSQVNLSNSDFDGANLSGANCQGANLSDSNFSDAIFDSTDLSEASLINAGFFGARFSNAILRNARFDGSLIGKTIFANVDLSQSLGLETLDHKTPSIISLGTLVASNGRMPVDFLRGCGLSDLDIKYASLYNPHLNNDGINKIVHEIYDIRATQGVQISPLFVSYNRRDADFVDKIGNHLNEKGVRFWRDTHDAIAGRIEKQIADAIRQNPTVLLILSEHSLRSDWVEHEVRTARELEKEMGRDVLCPIALDDSWKDSRWPKRIMEQIMEYNILDFSEWQDDSKFNGMFRKLIDGLELFYKG